MTAHYSGHDPATGCGYGCLVLVVLVVLVVAWLAGVHP